MPARGDRARMAALAGGLTAAASLASAALWLRRARLEPVRVAGSSMVPTLTAGTLLAAGPLDGPVRRGLLVLVQRPGAQGCRGPGLGDEPPELVKRVVGLPGESVRLGPDGLEIDGRPMPEPYLPAGAPPGPPFEVALGPDEYLVLGDRRDASTDGRAFGPLNRRHLVGRVRFVYWPPSVWRLAKAASKMRIRLEREQESGHGRS